MLVRLIIENGYDLEIVEQILCDSNRNLHSASLVEALWVVWNPIVDRVFNITNSVNVAKNFEMLDVSWVAEALDLFISIVLQEIDHVFIHIHYLRVLPSGGTHVNEPIQIVNAKADVDPVFWSQLYLVLAIPRKRV